MAEDTALNESTVASDSTLRPDTPSVSQVTTTTRTLTQGDTPSHLEETCGLSADPGNLLDRPNSRPLFSTNSKIVSVHEAIMCRWACAEINSTFMCKWCGTRFCRGCLRGEFTGLMREATICAKCNQNKCQGQRVETPLKEYLNKEEGSGKKQSRSPSAKRGKSAGGKNKSGASKKSKSAKGKKGGKKKKKK